MNSSRWAPMRAVSLITSLVAVLSSGGCATAPVAVQADPQAALRQARSSCAALRPGDLEAPIQTDVPARLKAIDAAAQAGHQDEAASLASALADACRGEAQSRTDVARILAEVRRDRARIDPRLYYHLHSLARSGNYSETVVCGEGILEGKPERCEAAERGPLASRTPVRPLPGSVNTPGPTRSFDERGPGDPGVSARAAPGPTLSLTPEAPEQPAETVVAATPKRSNVWPWVVTASGGVVLVGGAVLAGLAQQHWNTLDRRCPRCTQDEVDRGHRLAISADVLFGVGAATAVSGILWLLLEPRSHARPESGQPRSGPLTISITGVHYSGRF